MCYFLYKISILSHSCGKVSLNTFECFNKIANIFTQFDFKLGVPHKTVFVLSIFFQISLIRDGNKMDGNNIKSVRFIISAVVIILETFKRTLFPQILKPRVRFFRKRRSFNQTMTNLEHSIKILVSVFHSSFNAFE